MSDEDKVLPLILKNIDYARHIARDNQSAHIVIVVSGNELDKDTWQKRLNATGQHLFNNDNSTHIYSLQEKIGKKRKQGNFLGTLLAYIKLNEIAKKEDISFKDNITLIGMLFGRGERVSPFTQIEGDRKPAIIVSSRGMGEGKYLTAIEEALFYFMPVAKYIEQRGFKGIINKWGDETEIPSIDLSKQPVTGTEFAQYDVIKCVSTIKITSERAQQKEWIVSGSDDTITGIIPRNKMSVLIEILTKLGTKPDKKGDYYAGVSLGPVAVSYDVLDIALEVFDNEIYKQGIFIDFDPYFIMALSITSRNLYVWEEAEKNDKGLQSLLSKVPDFFSKVQRLKEKFHKKHGRNLRLKILDLGKDIFWADIGQHQAMRDKYMSLNDNDKRGIIARKLENISQPRDESGNIIINSRIDNNIKIKDSIIINSVLTGQGCIEQSVIKDSTFHNPVITSAFSILSYRPIGKTILHPESGLYRSIGTEDLVLQNGMRQGTILTRSKVYDMMISESSNLRDRDNVYNVPVFDNEISFAEAYDEMFGVSEEELERRRKTLIDSINNPSL